MSTALQALENDGGTSPRESTCQLLLHAAQAGPASRRQTFEMLDSFLQHCQRDSALEARAIRGIVVLIDHGCISDKEIDQVLSQGCGSKLQIATPELEFISKTLKGLSGATVSSLASSTDQSKQARLTISSIQLSARVDLLVRLLARREQTVRVVDGMPYIGIILNTMLTQLKIFNEVLEAPSLPQSKVAVYINQIKDAPRAIHILSNGVVDIAKLLGTQPPPSCDLSSIALLREMRSCKEPIVVQQLFHSLCLLYSVPCDEALSIKIGPEVRADLEQFTATLDGVLSAVDLKKTSAAAILQMTIDRLQLMRAK